MKKIIFVLMASMVFASCSSVYLPSFEDEDKEEVKIDGISYGDHPPIDYDGGIIK